MGNLSTPITVQKLQTALHAKAKSQAGYRFYALYDKIYRSDILFHAWNQCRANKGAPGVDGQDFEEVEKYGVMRWLGELALAFMARDHGSGGEVEPDIARLGKLLQCRLGHASVSGTRQLHRTAVAPVVTLQIQTQEKQGRELSTLAPVRALRARTSECKGA